MSYDQLVDLTAKFRLMEAHYHEDMNEVYDKMKVLEAKMQELSRKLDRSSVRDAPMGAV